MYKQLLRDKPTFHIYIHYNKQLKLNNLVVFITFYGYEIEQKWNTYINWAATRKAPISNSKCEFRSGCATKL